jgi:ubiquinone/menaquinone biosynthesis C-methylase UbiE
MRRLYGAALRHHTRSSSGQRVIDVGCGFGANLAVLAPFGDVIGVDVDFAALQAIEQRPKLGLVQARADALPFRAGSFEVVALLAVVEHVERDDRVASETHRIAHTDAIQILLTSAFKLLWSHHDVANNHCRRYRAYQIDRLLQQAGWSVLQTSYVNAFIFPLVMVVRLIQRCLKPTNKAIYDMGPPLGPFNRLLEEILGFEAWLVTRLRVKLPFGVDLFSVARRDD